MNNFYVYVHKRKTDGVVFYVGKGSGKRLNNTSKRSNHWKSIVNKYGFVAEIVEDNLQEWYAFELEQNLIAYYGRSDLKLGTLVNHSDGGEGTSGNILSENSRNKIKLKILNRSPEIAKAIGQKLRGRKASDEVRQKMKESQAKTQRVIDAKLKREQANPIVVTKRVHSEETKNKVSRSLKKFYEENGGKSHSYETRRKLSLSKNSQIVKLIHDSGEIFSGYIFDFIEKYKINIKPLFKTKPSKTCKGWRVCHT